MKVRYNFETGQMSGETDEIFTLERTLGETLDIYQDANISDLQKNEIAYFVQAHNPEPDKEGALQFGTSNLNAGDVNGEYFMTKGHTHEIANRAEYYFGIQGKGLLLLMDEKRETIIEEVEKGSLHYIKGFLAHRLVNISDETLVVGACWNADAGHNYDAIADSGFSVRIMKSNNEKGYEVKKSENKMNKEGMK